MSLFEDGATAVLEADDGMVRLELSDSTGTHTMVADFDRNLPAGKVARAGASGMLLAEDVPWALHNDQGVFLDDDQPIAQQLDPAVKTRLWVTPKTHLG